MAKSNANKANDAVSFSDDQKKECIMLVRGYPELWNLRAKVYRKTKLKDKNLKWAIIANQLNTTVKLVKALFKNLRTVFGRELSKCLKRTEHSGQSGDEDKDNDVYMGNWPFFYDLLFLKDTMKGREMSGPLTSTVEENAVAESVRNPDNELANILETNESGIGSSSQADRTTPAVIEVNYVLNFIQSDDEELDMFQTPAVGSSTTDSGVVAPPHKRKTAVQRVLDIEERKLKVYQEAKKNKTDDDDMLFLKSLHPYFSRAKDKLSLRCDVMSVIKEFLKSEELFHLGNGDL